LRKSSRRARRERERERERGKRTNLLQPLQILLHNLQDLAVILPPAFLPLKLTLKEVIKLDLAELALLAEENALISSSSEGKKGKGRDEPA
jgi:hypothetical protein